MTLLADDQGAGLADSVVVVTVLGSLTQGGPVRASRPIGPPLVRHRTQGVAEHNDCQPVRSQRSQTGVHDRISVVRCPLAHLWGAVPVDALAVLSEHNLGMPLPVCARPDPWAHWTGSLLAYPARHRRQGHECGVACQPLGSIWPSVPCHSCTLAPTLFAGKAPRHDRRVGSRARPSPLRREESRSHHSILTTPDLRDGTSSGAVPVQRVLHLATRHPVLGLPVRLSRIQFWSRSAPRAPNGTAWAIRATCYLEPTNPAAMPRTASAIFVRSNVEGFGL